MLARFINRTARMAGAAMLAGTAFTAASAQIIGRNGTIAQVFLSGGSNYGFRITLSQSGAD